MESHQKAESKPFHSSIDDKKTKKTGLMPRMVKSKQAELGSILDDFLIPVISDIVLEYTSYSTVLQYSAGFKKYLNEKKISVKELNDHTALQCMMAYLKSFSGRKEELTTAFEEVMSMLAFVPFTENDLEGLEDAIGDDTLKTRLQKSVEASESLNEHSDSHDIRKSFLNYVGAANNIEDAVKSGNIAYLRKLFAAGVDVNIRTKAAQTPFLLALHYKKIEILEELRNYYNLNFNAGDGTGMNGFHYFAITSLDASERFLRRTFEILKEDKVDISHTDALRRNCLHIAAITGNANAAALILPALDHKSIYSKDDSGHTAEFYASQSNSPDLMAVFRDAGIKSSRSKYPALIREFISLGFFLLADHIP